MSIRGAYADGDTVIVPWDGRGTTIENTTCENSCAWFMQNALTLPQAPVTTSAVIAAARDAARLLVLDVAP